MTTLSTTLFLGVPQTESIEQALKAANPFLKQMLHLEEIRHQEQLFIGKRAGALTDLNQLVLLEANVLSLLKKLLPELEIKATKLIAIHE